MKIGQVLLGFCGGYFGRNSYCDKRVEGFGADWVVAREIGSGGQMCFAEVSPEDVEAASDQELRARQSQK